MKASLLDDGPAIQIARVEATACQCCGTTADVVFHATRNTAYDYPAIARRCDPTAVEGDTNDPNYARLCPPCWAEDDATWDEMWRDYYGGRL